MILLAQQTVESNFAVETSTKMTQAIILIIGVAFIIVILRLAGKLWKKLNK